MAFTIQVGVSRDPKNKLNKTITDVASYSCVVKGSGDTADDINIMGPRVILKADDSLFSKNYAYIPNFNRYYFISSIAITPNGIYALQLKEDVLMSWRDSIKACEVQLARSADFRNYYLPDSRLPVTQQTIVTTKIPDVSPFDGLAHGAIVTIAGPNKAPAPTT